MTFWAVVFAICVIFCLSMCLLCYLMTDKTWISEGERNHLEEGRENGKHLRAVSNSLRNQFK